MLHAARRRRLTLLTALAQEAAPLVDRRKQLLQLLSPDRDPLARLRLADELAQVLRDLALEAHDAGYTWQDIGDELGVSRAAVHERFSPANGRASRRSRRVR